MLLSCPYQVVSWKNQQGRNPEEVQVCYRRTVHGQRKQQLQGGLYPLREVLSDDVMMM